MPLYKATAINIRSRDFGEADKAITLFTREKGKVEAIAKGARRIKSKFGGRLEIFSYNKYLLATGRSLDIISQCETAESFRKLREDTALISVGSYILWLTAQVVEEGHADTALFEHLLGCLYLLNAGELPGMVMRIYEVGLMKIEGILPVIDQCTACGKKARRLVDKVHFSLSKSGLLCRACRQLAPQGIYIDAAAVRWIQDAAAGRFDLLNKSANFATIAPEVDMLVRTFLEYQLGKELKDHRKENI